MDAPSETKIDVPRQIRMLVRIPAALPRSWRSTPMMPPQRMAVPRWSQNLGLSGLSASTTEPSITRRDAEDGSCTSVLLLRVANQSA